MGTPATIDVEALLAPISDDAPTGVDLRQDASPSSVYFKLKDAARAARRAETAADQRDDDSGQGAIASEWQVVMSTAPAALEQSKDLEIAAWYAEALLRYEGFAGLREGFALLTGLVERYWETFHSLPADDGALEDRLAPLAGLNGGEYDGTLIQPIRKVPITVANGEKGPLSYFHYQMAARAVSGGPRGAITIDEFTSAVSAGDGRYYATLLEDIEGALAQFETLTAAVDARAGRDSPPTSRIQGLLSEIRDTVGSVSKDLVAAAAPTPAPPGANGDAAAAPTLASQAPLQAAGPVRTREDALRTLLQIAEYFRTNEPQSPVPTILEETVRRARLSFADLLVDLLPNDPAVQTILTAAGIRPPMQA
jgi:type VI secretion system protein ImpA